LIPYKINKRESIIFKKWLGLDFETNHVDFSPKRMLSEKEILYSDWNFNFLLLNWWIPLSSTVTFCVKSPLPIPYFNPYILITSQGTNENYSKDLKN